MKAFSYLHDGFVYRLGSGNVFLWYDRWLDEDLLAELIPTVHVSDTDLRVKDVWFNGSWNFDKIVIVLPLKLRG